MTPIHKIAPSPMPPPGGACVGQNRLPWKDAFALTGAIALGGAVAMGWLDSWLPSGPVCVAVAIAAGLLAAVAQRLRARRTIHRLARVSAATHPAVALALIAGDGVVEHPERRNGARSDRRIGAHRDRRVGARPDRRVASRPDRRVAARAWRPEHALAAPRVPSAA